MKMYDCFVDNKNNYHVIKEIYKNGDYNYNTPINIIIDVDMVSLNRCVLYISDDNEMTSTDKKTIVDYENTLEFKNNIFSLIKDDVLDIFNNNILFTTLIKQQSINRFCRMKRLYEISIDKNIILYLSYSKLLDVYFVVYNDNITIHEWFLEKKNIYSLQDNIKSFVINKTQGNNVDSDFINKMINELCDYISVILNISISTEYKCKLKVYDYK